VRWGFESSTSSFQSALQHESSGVCAGFHGSPPGSSHDHPAHASCQSAENVFPSPGGEGGVRASVDSELAFTVVFVHANSPTRTRDKPNLCSSTRRSSERLRLVFPQACFYFRRQTSQADGHSLLNLTQPNHEIIPTRFFENHRHGVWHGEFAVMGV
jgi:hypothetical protein